MGFLEMKMKEKWAVLLLDLKDEICGFLKTKIKASVSGCVAMEDRSLYNAVRETENLKNRFEPKNRCFEFISHFYFINRLFSLQYKITVIQIFISLFFWIKNADLIFLS